VQETLQENYGAAIMRHVDDLAVGPFFATAITTPNNWRDNENSESNVRGFNVRAFTEHSRLF
jgi:hypothetical protein